MGRTGRLFIVLFAVSALIVGSLAAMLWRSASLLAEESAQRALLEETAALLAAYHDEHGHYPESLDELTFTYPDGGDRATLESLQYSTDGEFYIVKTIGAFSGKERQVCR